MGHTIPSQWGFCFKGNEVAFCYALEAAINGRSAGPETFDRRPFTYVEIGIGHGGALRAVREFLTANFYLPFRIIGVDLPTYTGYAAADGSIELSLTGDERFFETWNGAIDFCFIDACHGKPCTLRDFLLCEPLIPVGGVVAFHDTDKHCQGIHFQPHCGTGIDCRAAVQELGLLDDTRPGWKKILETPGWPPEGHGCLFVQKQQAVAAV